jgi:HNH endonuclease
MRKSDIGKKCSIEGCENVYSCRGYCMKHHREAFPRGECKFEGCDRLWTTQGWCNMHYHRFKNHGDPSITLINAAGQGHVDVSGYRRHKINGKSIMEHRMVMEQHIGRSLLPCENVHHKNGDTLDNRIENLEIWNTSQPAGQRPNDKIIYALEILATYAPEKLSKAAKKQLPAALKLKASKKPQDP